jgi:hypothetical protein
VRPAARVEAVFPSPSRRNPSGVTLASPPIAWGARPFGTAYPAQSRFALVLAGGAPPREGMGTRSGFPYQSTERLG